MLEKRQSKDIHQTEKTENILATHQTDLDPLYSKIGGNGECLAGLVVCDDYLAITLRRTRIVSLKSGKFHQTILGVGGGGATLVSFNLVLPFFYTLFIRRSVS